MFVGGVVVGVLCFWCLRWLVMVVVSWFDSEICVMCV